MKKLFTSVLMLSMVLAGMNVFNSCKDYDEDEYNDMVVSVNKNDADLRTLIGANYQNLKTTADSLGSVLADCQENCSTKLAALDEAVKSLAKQDSTSNASTLDSIKHLSNEIADLQTADGALRKNIKDVETTLAKVDSILGDSIGVVAGKVEINTTDIAKLFNIAHVLDSTITDVQSTVKTLSVNDSVLNAKIDTLESVMDRRFVTIESELKTVAATANEALARAINDSTWIVNYIELNNGRVDSLAGVTSGLSTFATDGLAALNLRADSLATVTNGLNDLISSAHINLEKTDSLLKKQDSLLWVSVNNINDMKIPSIESRLDSLAENDTRLAHSIDSLAEVVKANSDSIAEINTKLNTMTGRLDNIDNALKSLITGIIVQGTYNPVFGSFSLPLGISSNVLIAYYGNNDNPVVFPTTAEANYVKNSDKLTEADWNMISGGLETYKKNGNSVLFNETDDNAGTIYVTVNPNTVDFAGQQLTLVNSKDVESGVKLTVLKKENDTELKFGYTRAASNNGFYSAKASLKEDQIDNVKINIESGMQSAFKDVLNQRSAASIATLTGKLYNQFNGIAPANALKATWTDYNGEHSVYSQYGIAATAVKPLSFKFMEDVNVTKIPGYQRAWDLVDNIVGEFNSLISDNWPKLDNLTPPTINGVEIEPGDLSQFNIQIQIEFSLPTDYTGQLGDDGYLKVYDCTGIYIYDIKAGKVIKKEDGTYVLQLFEFENDLSGKVEEMYTTIETKLNEALQNSNNSLADFVGQVNDIFDQINEVETNLTNSTKDMQNKLISYLDKVNNKLCNVINNANSRIQPVLVVSDDNGTHFGSKAKNAPSVVASSLVTLRPTTYTGGVVAPEFKKHVACTNVFSGSASAQSGDAACKAALEAVNAQSNVNEVVEGSVRAIPVTLKSGYVYEFSYSALDYHGKISMHKYYVEY